MQASGSSAGRKPALTVRTRSGSSRDRQMEPSASRVTARAPATTDAWWGPRRGPPAAGLPAREPGQGARAGGGGQRPAPPHPGPTGGAAGQGGGEGGRTRRGDDGGVLPRGQGPVRLEGVEAGLEPLLVERLAE